MMMTWDIPIRLALGIIFFGHGARKLFGWFGGDGLSAVAKEFESMGLKPGKLMAFLAGSGQMIGALLVLSGWEIRIGAFLIAFEIFVGLFKVHLRNGFFLNWKNEPGKGHGIEYNLAIL